MDRLGDIAEGEELIQCRLCRANGDIVHNCFLKTNGNIASFQQLPYGLHYTLKFNNWLVMHILSIWGFKYPIIFELFSFC